MRIPLLHLLIGLAALGSQQRASGAELSPPAPPAETVAVVAYAAPRYTEAGRRARVQGVAQIAVVIGSSGKVVEQSVAQRLPMGLSDQALVAARSWRFNRSKAERRTATLEFVFELDSNPKAQARFEFTPPLSLRVTAPAPIVEVKTIRVGSLGPKASGG